MELNKKNIKKIVGIISFGIVLFFILQNFATIKTVFDRMIDILFPFICGAGLAFVVNIPLNAIERKFFKPKKLKNGKIKEKKCKRPISILLSFILIVLILALVIKIIIPQLISVIVMFVMDIPGIAYNIKEYAIELTKQYPDISTQIQGFEFDWNTITADIFGVIKNLASSLVSSSIGFIIKVIGGIFNAVIAVIFAVYILLSKEYIKTGLKKTVIAYFSEKNAETIINICSLSKDTFHNFITGQCLEAVILGMLCFIGMLLFRIPFAATVSVLVGVTALIPIVGAIIGMVVGAIIILSVSPWSALGFIIFLLILQQIETNVIYPKVVGSSVGLPGIWVLLTVAVGGSLGGIIGLIIGLPMVSVLYTIITNDINKKLKEKEIVVGEN